MIKKKLLAAVLSTLSTAAFSAVVVDTNGNGQEAAATAREHKVIELTLDGEPSVQHKEIVIARSGQGGAPSTFSWSSNGGNMPFPDGGDINVIVSSAISEAFAKSGGASFGGRTIKNAPYSAEVITEVIQTLTDGNQITKRTSQMFYRDSAGRTRSETKNDDGELRNITIMDAVEGNRLILAPKSKTATKMSFDRDFQKRIDELREKARLAVKDGKSTLIEKRPGEEIVITRVEGANPREEVKVSVHRMAGDTKISVNEDVRGAVHINTTPGASQAHSVLSGPIGLGLTGADFGAGAGPLSTAFQDRKWAAKATTKELGTRDFDGVRAEGKVRSYTIPAGEIGNKNPLVVSTETWTSPDLQITVYSKHSDPRTGDTIYRLANVKRTEQPMSLFMLPDGYRVKEVSAPTSSLKPLAPLAPPAPTAPPAPPRP